MAGYSQGDRKGKWLAIVKEIEKAKNNSWLTFYTFYNINNIYNKHITQYRIII
jgi:hypothetical protein